MAQPNKNQHSNVVHLSGIAVGSALFGTPLAVALVANYASVSLTGQNLLTNLFKTRKKNKLSKRQELYQKYQQKKTLSKNKTVDANTEKTEPQFIKNVELFKLISSLETSQQRHLRYRAMAYSSLTTTTTLITHISIGLIAVAVISGGLPILTQWGIKSVFVQIGALSGVALTSMAGESFTRYQSTRQWKNYATEIEHELRVKAYDHVQCLDMVELEKHSSGELANLIHFNPVKVRLFLEMIPQRIIDRTLNLLLGALFLLFFIPISLALALTALLLPYFLLRHFHHKIASQYQQSSQAEANVNKQLLNSLGGLPTIKSFTTEAHEVKCLAEQSNAMREQHANVTKLVSQSIELSQFSLFPGLLAPVAIGGIFVLTGQLSLTVFILQNAILPKVMQVMMHLSNDYHFYRNADIASQELNQLFNQQSIIHNGTIHLQTTPNQDQISFQNISFSYNVNERVLNNINLHIDPGETIAFVGPTGAGKTTITKLLLRFYDIQAGQILLNGYNLRDLDILSLRQAIGLVSQEVYLFPGTIYENICYGTPNSSDEAVMEAARIAEVSSFVSKLPNGFETIVGERGQKLSGGQRQRIAIARALLRNPPIMIMDEATSAIDNETEAAIQRAIARFSQGRITIIIAHRLSTVRHVDCIYVMKQGQIIEQGTHDNLLKEQGYYEQLWKLQTGENQLELVIPTLND